MGRACSTYGICEKYNILVEEPEGKKPVGRPSVDENISE
jgi:hypothetical protein